LTGGGTAGHVNPALAIGSVLAGPETKFLFVGVRGRAEEEIVPREGIPFKYVRASGFPGGLSFETFRFLANLLAGTLQSLMILARFRPDVIIGTGGYVSAPVILAASLLRKMRLSKARVFIHEQNAVPGKLNRLMGRFAHQVLVTFPETLSHFPKNGAHVGYPLRRRIAGIGREEARRKLDFKIPEGRKLVLVFGGSQGSRVMNRALVDALRYFLPHRDSLFLVHGVGLYKTREYDAVRDTEERLRRHYDAGELERIESFYVRRAYFHNIELLYALSDLVVARAGAGSLNEISAMALPALIIPKSNLPGDHQVMNARSMERAGAAEILYEQVAPVDGKLDEFIDGKVLADRILSLLDDPRRLEEMRRRSRSFLNRDAMVRVERMIRGTEGEPLRGSSPETRPPETPPLPGNGALLEKLEKAFAQQGSAFRPENVIPNSGDLECLKSRAGSLLTAASWQQRNLGVKLIGLLNAADKLPALVALFFDREPAPLVQRLLGGDFKQVGFIRRNIMTALVRLNRLTPEVEKALLLGMEDPYYEVRAEAARATAFFGDRLSSPEPFIAALERLLKDRIIEVAAAAAECLGRLGEGKDVLPILLGLKNARFWKVRAAALRGILSLVERGKAADFSLLEKEVPDFILTSTDFTPQFEIKSAYSRLMESVSMKKQGRAQ
jgi:UDP-N-acetylglucosamine--N-acetylmuramyl-(pentapeptide) pyrophosphoryl-undecaprenol N-acetylglucosamine transferase